MSKRIAYVTGGMGGIGTAICTRLCKDGYTVVAGCGPNSTRKDKWLATMREQGFDIHASEGNVSNWESTKAAFEKADKDGDGTLDKQEAKSMPRVAKNFDAIDADKDGTVSLDEIHAYMKSQRKGGSK